MKPHAKTLLAMISLLTATTAAARPSDTDKPSDPSAAAQDSQPDQAIESGQYDSEPESLKDEFINLLPEPVSKDLEIDLWGWLGYLRNDKDQNVDYWDAELSVAFTKSFEQRLALSLQVNYFNANGDEHFKVEQAYVSMLPFDDQETILTIGKFNANFGVEGRDFWNRKTGTTSLLFSAQPQDIVGAMVTQPLGDTGIKLKPFLSADFQGQTYFDQKLSFGLMTEYRPSSEWTFAVTGWIGPGLVLFGGEVLRTPYSQGAYGEDPGSIIENWRGPNLVAERAGTLYFLDAKVIWKAAPDLTLSAEYLFGTTKISEGRSGWHGWMVLGVYDISDRLHVFGRFSYLDDSDWLITGFFTTSREVSVGFGYEIFNDVEFRAEYRHDFANAYDDINSVSIHLTFTY